eukprot:10831582-Alexandrium_andersonii.AAC.1
MPSKSDRATRARPFGCRAGGGLVLTGTAAAGGSAVLDLANLVAGWAAPEASAAVLRAARLTLILRKSGP